MKRVVLVVFITLAFGLLAASCVTIRIAPKYDDSSKTLLVIPMEFVNKTDVKLNLVFSLNYDDINDSKTRDLLDFSNKYALIDDVTPGKHKITRLIVRWKETNQIIQQLKMDIPFEVYPGKITILPIMFSMKRTPEKTFFQPYNLMPEQYDKVKMDVQGFKNIETWEFYEPPKTSEVQTSI